MEDLISRKEAIKVLEALRENNPHVDARSRSQHNSEISTCIHRINILLGVDAKPVVHGKWIDTQPEYHHGFGRNAHVCSNCHDYYTTEYDDLYFCPRCGARMDGE